MNVNILAEYSASNGYWTAWLQQVGQNSKFRLQTRTIAGPYTVSFQNVQSIRDYVEGKGMKVASVFEALTA